MRPEEPSTHAVVDVVGQGPSPARRRWTVVVLTAAASVVALLAAAGALGGKDGHRVALGPAVTEAAVAVEPVVPTEHRPPDTVGAAVSETIAETIAAPIVTDVAPTDAVASTGRSTSGTVKPDNSGGCVGDQPKVFVPLIMPNLLGTELHGWLAAAQKFMWDGSCTHHPMSWEFQPLNGDCAPNPSLVGLAYLQTPSPGTPFELGSVHLTLTVYVDCSVTSSATLPTMPSPPPPPPPTPPPPPPAT